ncbi:hypothetical protein OS493_018581, partial [Desmophyllum pertusum]
MDAFKGTQDSPFLLEHFKFVQKALQHANKQFASIDGPTRNVLQGLPKLLLLCPFHKALRQSPIQDPWVNFPVPVRQCELRGQTIATETANGKASRGVLIGSFHTPQ